VVGLDGVGWTLGLEEGGLEKKRMLYCSSNGYRQKLGENGVLYVVSISTSMLPHSLSFLLGFFN
jgi:hypothetical protein